MKNDWFILHPFKITKELNQTKPVSDEELCKIDEFFSLHLIQNIQLYSLVSPSVMLVSSFIGGNGGFDWGSGNTYKNRVLKFDLEEYNWTIYGGMDAYRRHHAVELVNYADFLPYVDFCYPFWSWNG